jgi:hypothetical protein
LQRNSKVFQRWGKPVFGGLMIAIVLLLNLLAASPKLHECVHQDASQPGHQCAVVVFAHGKVDTAVSDAAAPLPVLAVESFSRPAISIACVPAKLLPPGRAPPVSSSNS